MIGLPMPGFEVRMVPNEGKLELRVRGPNVTPGYFRRADLTAEALDAEGFFRIGDAGRFADPAIPSEGVVFDGRVAEDFKLTTGTWVQVGARRLGALEAAAPLLQDAVVTGHDRDYLGLLAWPNLEECRRLADLANGAPVEVVRTPAVVEAIRGALQACNAGQQGSSTRIARVLLLAEPPSLDADEISDKGYINQRATLANRAHLVARLYEEPPADDVIVL